MSAKAPLDTSYSSQDAQPGKVKEHIEKHKEHKEHKENKETKQQQKDTTG